MDHQLRAATAAGQQFVALAEREAGAIEAESAERDAKGTFAYDAFERLKASGLLRGPVPEQFGGLGVDSVHDVMVAVNRLGRADGSVAIAANMHLAFVHIATRRLRGALERGDTQGIARAELLLALLGGGAIAMANATEPGTDIRHPLAEIHPAPGGWALTGRKSFGTLSNIADVFFVTARRELADGSMQMAYVFVPRHAEGQTILDNWDALGMRASGSNDVVYDGCVVPDEMVLAGSQWGEDDDITLLVATGGALGLAGAFLGIAEAARKVAIDLARRRTKASTGEPIAHRPGVQRVVAEMESDLLTCRAVLDRTGLLLDDYLCHRAVSEVPISELHQLNREMQCAKLVANRTAIKIVDDALTLSGGSGYLRESRLAQLYRDVRAGPLMQPLSPLDAYEYIGRVALGLSPTMDD